MKAIKYLEIIKQSIKYRQERKNALGKDVEPLYSEPSPHITHQKAPFITPLYINFHIF